MQDLAASTTSPNDASCLGINNMNAHRAGVNSLRTAACERLNRQAPSPKEKPFRKIAWLARAHVLGVVRASGDDIIVVASTRLYAVMS